MTAHLAKALLVTAATVMSGYTGLSLAVGVAMTEGAMRLPRKPLDESSAARVRQQAEATGVGRADVAIRSADGLQLHAWLFTPHTSNGKSLLLLHGQADNRLAVSSTALWLAREGFVVLTPDSRGHGENARTLITYGVREADDTRRWLNLLRDRAPGGCLYLIGQSMGAANALQALPAPDVCGVVAESPFADLREVAVDRQAAVLRIPNAARSALWLPTTIGLIYSRAVRGVDLRLARPARAAARTTTPILLVHGLADVEIPPRHAALIAANAPHVVVWLVPGGAHTAVWRAAPDEYRRRILDVLK